MPKANLERNTFVKGLITEASPLIFPENASIDELNFQLNRDGSRQRRLGMDIEPSGVQISTSTLLANFNKVAISSFRWENAGNNGSITIGVVQVGEKLTFVDAFKDTLSTNILGTLTLSTAYAADRMDFTQLNGDLIAVSKSIPKPLLIKYDGTDFTSSEIDIKVRDIWGIEETGVEVDFRDATINKIHEYNLFNQGWTTITKGAIIIGSSASKQVYFHQDFKADGADNVYPSNADIASLGKDANGLFNPSGVREADIGKRQAPRGRVIVDPFNRGQSRRSFINDLDAAVIASTDDVNTIPLDNNTNSITTIASYAGRVFYAGVDGGESNSDSNSPLLGNTIFFTKQTINNADLGKCHTENDPSSEEFSDLLPTDGGTLSIPEASNILKLISNESSLIVVAENGVWSVSGTDGIFKADAFSISRVSNIGGSSAAAIISVEGVVYYWSKAGIYILSGDKVSGKLNASNISETTIQTFYTAIPSVGRSNAVGRYDSDSRKISWLYNDSASYDGVNQVNKYNKELILDTVLGSFYIYDIATTDSYVAGYLPTGGFNILQNIQNIVTSAGNVQASTVDVITSRNIRSVGKSRTKYISIKPSTTVTFTFSLYTAVDFTDWTNSDGTGTDATAHMITGYELFKDSMRRKNIPYLVMHFKRTEDGVIAVGPDLDFSNKSGCLIQTQWDFADSTASGKFGTPFQAYRLPRLFTPTIAASTLDLGFSVISTKNKLRGSGRSFSMRLNTEAGKDCHVYGWGINVGGNTNV